MPKRSSDRHLAKNAARRQAERDAAARRRSLVVGSVVGVLGCIVVIVGLSVLLGDGTETAAPSDSPSRQPIGDPVTLRRAAARRPGR